MPDHFRHLNLSQQVFEKIEATFGAGDQTWQGLTSIYFNKCIESAMESRDACKWLIECSIKELANLEVCESCLLGSCWC